MQINPTGLEAKSAGLTPSGVSSIPDIYWPNIRIHCLHLQTYEYMRRLHLAFNCIANLPIACCKMPFYGTYALTLHGPKPQLNSE